MNQTRCSKSMFSHRASTNSPNLTAVPRRTFVISAFCTPILLWAASGIAQLRIASLWSGRQASAQSPHLLSLGLPDQTRLHDGQRHGQILLSALPKRVAQYAEILLARSTISTSSIQSEHLSQGPYLFVDKYSLEGVGVCHQESKPLAVLRSFSGSPRPTHEQSKLSRFSTLVSVFQRQRLSLAVFWPDPRWQSAVHL